ncbi:phosphatase PAP2 family protein [Paenibacillus kobensis]|uniref:phosphatase PAP2 family protein n=1 Tax=Paenibacillus kobensis TaxID=59841 RepID=UPI000FD9E686|nr:phosphatase PAP2 family protein [Paenibacillus kobensis]
MRIRIGAVVLGVCVLLFIIIAAVLPESGPLMIDEKAAQAVRHMAGHQGEQVWKAVTELGSSTIIIAAALVYTAWLGWRLRSAAVLWIPAGGAAAYLLNQGLKTWLDRERPTGAWGIEFDGASFPSGNAMLAMAVYGTMMLSFLLYTKAGRVAKSTAAIVGVAIIVCVGFSRLFFGVHYVTDIIAGYAAGGAVMMVSLYLLGTSIKRKQRI